MTINPNTSQDDNNREIIRFRPHHFMCTLSFRGKGYSLGFIKNYKKIVEKLNNNTSLTPLEKLSADEKFAVNTGDLNVQPSENIIIEVVQYMDDICKPCPNRLDDTICKIQDKISKLDARHAEILNIKAGDRMSWTQAKNLIKEKMSIDKFNSACAGCRWKPYGLCEESLRALHDGEVQ